MDIRFSCEHCDQHIAVPARLVGQKMDCPRCRKQVEVPNHSTYKKQTSLNSLLDIRFSCSGCSQHIVVPSSEAGRTTKYPNCNKEVRIPDHSTYRKRPWLIPAVATTVLAVVAATTVFVAFPHVTRALGRTTTTIRGEMYIASQGGQSFKLAARQVVVAPTQACEIIAKDVRNLFSEHRELEKSREGLKAQITSIDAEVSELTAEIMSKEAVGRHPLIERGQEYENRITVHEAQLLKLKNKRAQTSRILDHARQNEVPWVSEHESALSNILSQIEVETELLAQVNKITKEAIPTASWA